MSAGSVSPSHQPKTNAAVELSECTLCRNRSYTTYVLGHDGLMLASFGALRRGGPRERPQILLTLDLFANIWVKTGERLFRVVLFGHTYLFPKTVFSE